MPEATVNPGYTERPRTMNCSESKYKNLMDKMMKAGTPKRSKVRKIYSQAIEAKAWEKSVNSIAAVEKEEAAEDKACDSISRILSTI